ncbi:MAG TPA: bifunctional methylenetetrahydrofolate dehydrogenase/methenyltetrahydrofolate cyclohydrolase FolD [Solirubrobacteraceae bacterium]|nr:bifunctional methylenetetrahydrofolate dehydrogenase/methenyltetrahydrofolate cyclohydrolase FolD [Solirubrobacteraceae bacterium]
MGYSNVRGVPQWDRRSPRSATIIDGKAVAAQVRAEVAEQAAAFEQRTGQAPGLATILVGDDPASAVYVAAKHRACGEAGITSFHHHLDAGAEQAEVEALIDQLNADPAVSGILCQLPVPPPLDGAALTRRIDPGKDVDGLSPLSAGALALGEPGLRPCTPAGVMHLLASLGWEPRGRSVVVIGRSNLFGKPMAQLLLAADATVTVAHSRTADLPARCRAADALIVAAGRPGMVEGSWIKPGAIVIDVGISRTSDGLKGDVDFEAALQVAGAVTPVPGGVGPMTIAMLLQNTVHAARATVGEFASPA